MSTATPSNLSDKDARRIANILFHTMNPTAESIVASLQEEVQSLRKRCREYEAKFDTMTQLTQNQLTENNKRVRLSEQVAAPVVPILGTVGDDTVHRATSVPELPAPSVPTPADTAAPKRTRVNKRNPPAASVPVSRELTLKVDGEPDRQQEFHLCAWNGTKYVVASEVFHHVHSGKSGWVAGMEKPASYPECPLLFLEKFSGKRGSRLMSADTLRRWIQSKRNEKSPDLAWPLKLAQLEREILPLLL